MSKYFKANWKILSLLVVLVVLSGPAFSVILSFISEYLNRNLGDWLSFYGAMTGIVVSLIVIHLQLSFDKESEKEKYRPVLS